MGGGKGGGSGSQMRNYFGSIGGIVCSGPVDELIAVLIDGSIAWPRQRFWADGVDALQVTEYKRKSGVATVMLANVPQLYPNDFFVLSGMDDASFNCAIPTAATATAAAFVSYANAGADVPWTNAAGGLMTKVLAFVVNNIVSRNGEMFQCISNHVGLVATGPPNVTYWKRWSVKRVDVGVNPYGFTIPNRGFASFYWGTATQTLYVGGVLAKQGHPPYRNQAVIELQNFLFGIERTTAPNVEVVVRRAPQQSIIVNSSADLDADGQANPAAMALEIMTNPITGMGLDSSLFDAASWRALADALAAVASKTHLSCKLDRAISGRNLLMDLLSYYDGWLRWSPAGLIEAGKFSHNEAPPAFDASNTINFHDLIEEIKWDTQGWPSTSNVTLVRIDDRARAWKDGGAMDRNSWNRQLVGEPRPNTLERPFITRRLQAAAYAAEYGKINAQQKLTGDLVARAEKVASIREGDLFLLVHDALQFSIVCRCIEKVLPAAPSGRANLNFEMERGIAPLPYHASPDTPGATAWPPPEQIQFYQFVQPPPALADGDDFRLSVLAARAVPTSNGLRLWLKKDDSDLFYDLGEQKKWAVAATLAQDYADNLPDDDTEPPDDTTETLQLNLNPYTPTADLQSISETQTEDAINDNNLLIWVFQAGSPSVFEVMTVREIRLDAGVYKLKVRRARFGTQKIAFSTDDLAYILHREDLVVYAHDKFPGYARSGTPATFGLQSFTAASEGDTSDPNQFVLFDYTFADPYAPLGTWLSLQKKSTGDADFADIADLTVTFDPTDKFQFSFQLTDANADLVSATLVGRLGSVEQTLWSSSFAATALLVQSTVFSLAVGTWDVFLVLKDASGTVKEFPLTAVGGGTPETLTVDVAAPTQCATPVGTPAGGPYPVGTIHVTLTSTTPGATLSYTLEPAGISAGYTVPIAITIARNSHIILYTKAIKAGMTDSPIGRQDYWWKSS